jgi:predicted transposase/invertase (TIGR01784 family)
MDKNNPLKPGEKFKIITPHNDLFLRVMTRKDKAIAFFKICLPKKILQATDLNQAELTETKHIRDRGHSFYNDLLYRCPLLKDGKQIGHVILTSEHQSKPDPKMVLRMTNYNLATIEDHIKQKHDKFPVLVNIIFHTGNKPWNYSLSFSDYYADPDLGSEYFNMAGRIKVKFHG